MLVCAYLSASLITFYHSTVKLKPPYVGIIMFIPYLILLLVTCLHLCSCTCLSSCPTSSSFHPHTTLSSAVKMAKQHPPGLEEDFDPSLPGTLPPSQPVGSLCPAPLLYPPRPQSSMDILHQRLGITQVCACVRACVHACVRACVCVRVHTYIHTYAAPAVCVLLTSETFFALL